MMAAPCRPPRCSPMPDARLQALALAFDQAATLLEPAVNRGYGSMVLADYRAWVLDGTMQLWRGPGYAAVTEVVNYPRSRVVIVHLAGGELDALVDADGELDKFARVVEATGIEIIGRRGWVRALRDRGYTEAAVHLYKEVGHGQL